MTNKASRNGFTLTELTVVVAILGILSAIAVPNFKRYTRQAKQAEATVLLSQISMAEGNFFGLWNQYTTDLTSAGFAPTGRIIFLAGFSANRPWSSGTASTRYPTTPALALNGNRNDSRDATVCLPAQCTYVGSPTALSGTFTVGQTGATQTFTAAAQGVVGGTTVDRWTINQMKVITHPVDGAD